MAQKDNQTQMRSFWMRNDLVERMDQSAKILGITKAGMVNRAEYLRFAAQVLSTLTAKGPASAASLVAALQTMNADRNEGRE